MMETSPSSTGSPKKTIDIKKDAYLQGVHSVKTLKEEVENQSRDKMHANLSEVFTPPTKRPSCLSVSQQSSAQKFISFIFDDVIEDCSSKVKGQDAVFCDGHCNTWLHRDCAGLSKTAFKKVIDSIVTCSTVLVVASLNVRKNSRPLEPLWIN